MPKIKTIENNGDPGLPLIIVNPKSAGGSTRTRWSQLAADLSSHFGPYSVAFTKAPGDGTRIARDFIASGRRFLIACGGDGTVNEVANGILDSGEEVEMGVYPAGTGGDFRRTIGISSIPREAAKELRDGRTKLIDVGKVEFVGHEGENASRYFVNISSFGLSASINRRVKQKGGYQWIPNDTVRGRTKFALSTIQEILENEFLTVRVSIDGRESKTLNTINFCICNARYFGGGMKVAPDASLTDGEFDVVNIGDINTGKIILNGYKLYRGSHLDLAEVKILRAAKVKIEPVQADAEIRIETDGEIPGRLPATYQIVPKALRLRIPSKARKGK